MKREENLRFLLNQSKKNPTDIKRRMGLSKEFEVADENKGHPQDPFTSISPASKNKILGERNAKESSYTRLETAPKEKLVINSQETHPLFSKIHSFSDSSPSVPYDPVTNYTSPRPAFLHYNPDQRKEILLRMKDEEVSEVGSIEEDSLSVSSSHNENQENEEECSDVEEDEFEEREAEVKRVWCSRKVLKLLLLFGVFLFSYYHLFWTSSPSNPFQGTLPNDVSLLYRHLLKTHIGLPNLCSDIGEGTCDLFSQGDSERGILGDSSMNDLLGSDETNGGLSLDELEESAEDMIYVDRSQNVEELVIEEERGKPVICHEALELECNNQIEVSAKEENLENETIEVGEESVIEEREDIGEESVIEEEREQIGEKSVIDEEREEPVIIHEPVEHKWNIESEGSAKEEILASGTTENLNDFEDTLIYREALVESNSALESEGEGINETSLTWKHVLEFASKSFRPLFLPLSLLTGMVALSSVLFKYFAKYHKKSSRISTKDSNLNPQVSNHSSKEHEEHEESFVVPCCQPADDKRIYPSASVMEELRIEGGKVSNVNNDYSPSSSSVSDEIKGSYATRPPIVELLGELEFSFVDAQTMKSKRYGEPKISALQEHQLSQSERSKMVKIKSSPSSNKVDPYLGVESTSHEKLVKKEVTGEKSEGKKVAVTPVRRSNRLRNRVTSPTQ